MVYEPPLDGPLDPVSLIHGCVESGSEAILLERNRLRQEFFDLKSGVAGELLHRLSLYRLRLAAVVPDIEAHGERFGEFAREANRGQLCRFFATREDAWGWLRGDSTSST